MRNEKKLPFKNPRSQSKLYLLKLILQLRLLRRYIHYTLQQKETNTMHFSPDFIYKYLQNHVFQNQKQVNRNIPLECKFTQATDCLKSIVFKEERHLRLTLYTRYYKTCAGCFVLDVFYHNIITNNIKINAHTT